MSSDDRTVAHVREKPGASPPPNWGPAIRLQFRMDMYTQLQRLDWSLIVWEHPRARVVANEVWSDIGPLHQDLELSLAFSKICGHFDLFADPFPYDDRAPDAGRGL